MIMLNINRSLQILAITAVILICFMQATLSSEMGRLLFPHINHMEELDCADCHELNKNSDEPGFPNIDVCLECHDDPEEFERPFYFDRNNGEHQQNKIFTYFHKSHDSNDCKDCHHVVEEALPSIPKQTDCEKCHTKDNINLSCKNCHIKGVFIPSNHNAAWDFRHGRIKSNQFGAPVHGNDCDSCHFNTSCNSCHRSMRPKSHTGFFRIRGHGIKAETNRKSCGTCHKESYCIRCHQQTKPIYHRGLWQYSHGLAIPGGKTGSISNCGLCHKQTWCAQCHNKH
jgi:hypothetical protein